MSCSFCCWGELDVRPVIVDNVAFILFGGPLCFRWFCTLRGNTCFGVLVVLFMCWCSWWWWCFGVLCWHLFWCVLLVFLSVSLACLRSSPTLAAKPSLVRNWAQWSSNISDERTASAARILASQRKEVKREQRPHRFSARNMSQKDLTSRNIAALFFGRHLNQLNHPNLDMCKMFESSPSELHRPASRLVPTGSLVPCNTSSPMPNDLRSTETSGSHWSGNAEWFIWMIWMQNVCCLCFCTISYSWSLSSSSSSTGEALASSVKAVEDLGMVLKRKPVHNTEQTPIWPISLSESYHGEGTSSSVTRLRTIAAIFSCSRPANLQLGNTQNV